MHWKTRFEGFCEGEKQRQNNSHSAERSETRGYLRMENSIRCCIFLFVIVTAAMGLPMVIYGNQCSNAEKRAANKDGHCKHIHNDGSAKALLVIGGILTLPLSLVGAVLSLYCYCFILAGFCEDNTVAPTDNSGSGFVICVGFSD